MPRREPAIPAATARLRRLQARLPELPVPALLRLRDAIEPLLERERVRLSDVNAVLRAAGRD
ncbi:MAG: hypothetical protein ACRENL_09880 [Candidatus Dormibacteria bacterium]